MLVLYWDQQLPW